MRTMLEVAGKLWLSGVGLDWPETHSGDSPRRVPLPTYPFERALYVVEPAQREPAGQSRRPAPAEGEQRLYAPSWARDKSVSAARPRLQGAWVVLADGAPLTKAVIERFEAAGATPILAEAGSSYERLDRTLFRVRPDDSDDVAALLRDVGASYGRIAGAVMLLDAPAPAAALVGSPTRGYAALVNLATGLEAHGDGDPVPVVAVTFGAQSVLDEPVVRPEGALLVGPTIVLPTEAPSVRVRSVDFELGAATPEVSAIARMLVAEAASDAAADFSAWRKGRRWLRRHQPVSLPPVDVTDLPLKRGGSYLITGGLGGIGLALAAWLAKVASARLLLTGRHSLPPREAWEGLLAKPAGTESSVPIIRAILDIEAMGGTVVTAVADAADLAAMEAAIAGFRERWGELDGVIHAAGVPGAGRLAVLQDDQEVQSVLAPKVDGLRVLTQLLGDAQLDFVALMSSISSVVGSPGTCGYAAANAVFDSFVESEARPGAWKHVFAINWGPWREIGMAANLAVPDSMREARDAFLRTGIATDAGVDAFARILGSGRRRVVMTSADLEAPFVWKDGALQGLPLSGGEDAPARPNASGRQASADVSEAGERLTATERSLATIWTELMGVSQPGVDDDFFELGGHSLLATRVLARVAATFGVRLALRDIFSAPTIRSFAERIDSLSEPRPSAPAEAMDDREEILI